jgi:UDP:flavonoid glycosyltransferase YjiC (YdhE family)
MRYLFCSLTSIGLLGPSMVLAQELQQRGHEVAFVTGPEMQLFLNQAQLARIPRGEKDGPSFSVETVWGGLDVIRQVRHIEYACKSFSPDVLVGQALTWGAMLASTRHHLPLAVIGLASYLWPTTPPLPYYTLYNQYCPYFQPSFYTRVHERYSRALDIYTMGCSMLNIPYNETSYAESPLLGDLFLLQSVPALEKYPHYLPNRVHFVGDCRWNPPWFDEELQRWLEQDTATPVIHLQIGRILKLASTDFGQQLIQVLGRLPVRVAASLGELAQKITTLPDNILVRPHISLEQVLPYTHSVICSGTTTALLGALSHGLPLLLIPTNGEEPYDLAFRCLDAQVGLCLPAQEATEMALYQKITELLQRTDLSLNAKKLQQAFKATSGAHTAADLLELLGTQRTPVLRQTLLSAS